VRPGAEDAMSARTSSSASSLRAVRNRSYPRRASSLASSLPIPELAPVMKTVLATGAHDTGVTGSAPRDGCRAAAGLTRCPRRTWGGQRPRVIGSFTPDQRLLKKIENHTAAVALHFMHYNFDRPHKTVANPYPRTPAMAAGVAHHVWTLREILALLD
jgi:hypothetical protein